MSEKQRTLKGIVKVNGIGLHTGLEVNLEIHPAPDNHGYKFQRVDLEGKPTIKADVDLVVSTERGTTLEQNNAKVHTTEHVFGPHHTVYMSIIIFLGCSFCLANASFMVNQLIGKRI